MVHEVSKSRTWLSEHRSVHLSLPSPHCLCLYHLAQNTCSCITLPPLVRPVALRHPSKSQLRSHPCKPLSLCFGSPEGPCSRHPMRIMRVCGLPYPWPRGSDQASFRQAWACLCTLSTRSYYCCSVARLCPTVCDHVDCSLPGFFILHYLPEFAQTHVHWVDNAFTYVPDI